MKYYVYGVIINLLLLTLLRLTVNTDPKTTYWYYTDATEYIAYAEGFLATGTFYDRDYNNKWYIKDSDGEPGYRRTIGYPLIIATTMYLFGDNWLLALQIFNCFFFALLYLILPKIIYELFGVNKERQVFWTLLLLGIVFARIPQVLNNTTFTVLLFLSILIGIKAIKSDNIWLYLIYVALISFTATIRLNLSWYFIFNALLILYLKIDGKWPIIISTSALLIITCNFNSIRNYYNHDVFFSSTINGLSYTEYFGKDITGDTVRFHGSIQSVIDQQNAYILATVAEHPVKAGLVILKNSKNVALDNHPVNNIANYYGYNWKDFKGFKKSLYVQFLYNVYALVYLVLFLYSLLIIYQLYQDKEWALIAMIGYFFMFWLAPALIIGTGGSRLRMDYEIFFIILFIGYKTKQVPCWKGY